MPMESRSGDHPKGTMDAGSETVFVVDDDIGTRSALSRFLQSAGLRCETFELARQFLQAYDCERSGCLVLDIQMPEMSGLELYEHLAAERSSLPVIVVSGHADVGTAVRAMKLGSFDFLEKPCAPEHLLERIQAALARARRFQSDRERRESLRERIGQLTSRQREILAAVVKGNPSKAIANQLGLTVSTVDNHRANIMKKLHAASAADLTRIAVAADPQLLEPLE
jgi:two-component system, LuxR family, response regulator FixJ